MSLEHELAELSTVYQSTVERVDILELQVNALHEREAELETLVRDYDGLLLLNPLNILPESASSQARRWYAKVLKLQERKRELLHELGEES